MRAVAPAVVPAVVAVLASSGIAQAELGSTTTINGEKPPGVMEKLTDIVVLVDSVGQDGERLVVQRGIRKPGTRAPIQYHGFAGNTCVMTGTMTHFVEGADPVVYPAGACYETPMGVATTAANLGTDDVRLIDTVVLPSDAGAVGAIFVLEPGWPDLTDPTG